MVFTDYEPLTRTTRTMSIQSMKIYGLPFSSNVLGPLMLAEEVGVGRLEYLDLMKGEHKQPKYLRRVHEYGQIPGMVDPNDIDPTFHLGESNAMLRYIANKYHKEAYPVGDPARCAQIDFAIDSFNRVVEKHAPVVYPLLGFIPPPPADAFAELLGAYKDAISKWCDIFLGDTFVGGSTPSIADYKAASFLIVAVHPALKEMCPTWEPPARVRTFMDDFANKVCCASIMHAGFGGNSICEFIYKKSIENKAKKAAA